MGGHHEPTKHWQDTLNDAGGRPAEHLCEPPIPVTVRVVWATDGEEHIETVAVGWSGRLVKVRMDDRRWHANAMWLRAEDVRRR